MVAWLASAELPTLPDSAESSLKINQSFHVLMNKFDKLADYGNLCPIMLTVILNIALSSLLTTALMAG